MRVITKRRLQEFWKQHPNAESPLRHWFNAARFADWNSLADVRQSFAHADPVGDCIIFNIAGNNYRLIAVILFRVKIVLVRQVLTHKEYDKGDWKSDCNI